MTARVLGIVVAMACSVCGSAASATNLKPLDPAALRATVEAIAKELMLPGAMVLLRTPQGDFAFGYGATELGGTTPPRADTHFRAASNTKTMTAAVILLLAQDGKLGFDDPVSKYVEGVPNGDAITIAELLNMRSGLYNYTSTPELAESVERDPTRAWTPEELLALAFKRPPDFAPGAEYEYNNTNYYLLGLVAEKIDGKPLADIFQDRLFAPLGMQHTLLPASTRMPSPSPSRTAISTAAPLTPWRMRLIPPISLRRPRREASNPTTTHGSIPPTPIRPAASSRRRTIWPFGSRAGRRQSFQRRHPAPVARQPQAGRSE